MPMSLVILGYSEAAMYVRSRPIAALISIHGRHEYGIEVEVPHRLDLGFDDVEMTDESTVEGRLALMRQRNWEQLNGRESKAPTREDAAAIVAFAREIESVDGVLLCQCGAGISRAPAAAIICLATWLGEGREREVVDRVLSIRPSAQPHRGLLAYAGIRFSDDDTDERG